ncbi:MAG: Phosphoethanolamine transferase for glucans alkaline phosphatase superfamily [Massilia sp.]|nr:Phosphoethanolamine transferase for glucans alkaline phosphatase superfamily [Massilia sp.]
MQKIPKVNTAGLTDAPPKGRAAAIILACWLLLPTIAGLWAGRNGPEAASSAVGVTMLAIGVLAVPLVLLGSARHLFLFWLPVGLLAPLQLYLIYFFGSVPGDAVTASALHLSVAETIELVGGFGSLALVLPLSWAAYLLLWRRIDPSLRLSANARKALAAGLLSYAMVGMHAEQTLSHYIAVPALFNEAIASATYPAGAALSLARVLKSQNAATQPMVVLHAAAPATPQVVILVIGESVRPDHLGINGYARDTTPELAKIGPALMSFSDVASTTNYTAGAVPNLVLRAAADGSASLVSVFREAGFRTAWFSNQQSDIFTPQADLSDFSDTEWHQGIRQDVDLLPLLESCLKQCGERQLIVLHMYGSHFPYDARYLRRDQVFAPIFRDAGFATARPQLKRELINSYDNTLLAGDRFLAGVIARAKSSAKPAVVLFTSDHGENLYDDERQLFMHIGPHPSRADSMVPMLFWANDAYAAGHAGKLAAIRNQLHAPVNHLAVMPTLLDLAGIAYDGKDPAQSLASGRFHPLRRTVAATDGRPIAVDSLR